MIDQKSFPVMDDQPTNQGYGNDCDWDDVRYMLTPEEEDEEEDAEDFFPDTNI